MLSSFLTFLSAEGVLTQDDFIPPPPTTKELWGDLSLPSDSRKGLYLTYSAVAAGSIFSLFSLHETFNAALDDPSGGDVQTHIVLTGTALLGTAFLALLADSLKSNSSAATSEE